MFFFSGGGEGGLGVVVLVLLLGGLELVIWGVQRQVQRQVFGVSNLDCYLSQWCGNGAGWQGRNLQGSWGAHGKRTTC